MRCLPSAVNLLYLGFVASNLVYKAAARFPVSVDEALQEYPSRRDSLLEVYVYLTNAEPLPFLNKRCNVTRQCVSTGLHSFGTFEIHGSTFSFRRIAAWLIAHKKHYQSPGNYGNNIPNPNQLELAQAPEVVSNWTWTIYKYARTGTDTSVCLYEDQLCGGGKADYDMGEQHEAVESVDLMLI